MIQMVSLYAPRMTSAGSLTVDRSAYYTVLT